MSRPRRLLTVFFLAVLAMMAVLPAMNLRHQVAPPRSIKSLFAVDVIVQPAASLLSRLGISLFPSEVIVGESGWLFLGDHYQQAITVKRRPAEAADVARLRHREEEIEAWSTWFAAHGVQTWKVLVCADKDSIYPELLPAWYRLAPGTIFDMEIQDTDRTVVVESRSALRGARGSQGLPLYRRTDTHWTARGAWIGYRELALSPRVKGPELAWLDEHDVQLVAEDEPPGDLTRLLRTDDLRSDLGAASQIDTIRVRDRTQYDAFSGVPVSWADAEQESMSQPPISIQSPHALNPQRLLWLRDSFGGPMLPYLAATFSVVVEVHRDSVDARRLEDLVTRFKPDVVIDAAAERNARIARFGLPPA